MDGNKLTHSPPAARVSRPALSSRFSPIVQPLILALVTTLVLFGAYEFVERTWLTDLPMQTLHWLHTLRGILSSLLAAAVVAWMIVKNSPGFLAVAPADEEWSTWFRLTDADRIRTYARWFAAMRWVAVLLAGSLVFISVRLVEWLPREVWWPLVLSILVLAASNAAYLLLIAHGYASARLLLVQAYADLILLTILLHFSGGIENPLSTMMIFHVIIAGILLPRRQCYWISAAASLLFALMAWLEWSELVSHYTLKLFPHFRQASGELFHPAHYSVYVITCVFLQAVVLFLSAYFVTSLAERLRAKERQLETLAQRALAGQQLLEQSLETTRAGLRVLGRDLQPYWSNQRWNEWFARPPREPGPTGGVGDGDSSPAHQCLQDGSVHVTELVVDLAKSTKPDGESQRVFQVTTAPLPDLDGHTTRVVELAQDITEQKKTQARILHAGKLAAIGELAGQVAHEVNNPISIISAKASLLLSDHKSEMSPKVAEELGKITDLAKRVARIAQGLLTYCRPCAVMPTRVDLRVALRKALAVVEEQARRQGVSIEDRLPEQTLAIRANAHELEQVFLNLFFNALDAMPKGGWLTISATPADAALPAGKLAVAVVVADTGSGIPEEIRDKIFEPFFTTKKDGRGTGLGLSICLGVIRSHGGELKIESKIWQGTRVTVKLPADSPARKEEPHRG